METIEKERMNHQIELTEVKNQLCVVEENLNAMETIMQSQLKDLNGQLNEAKEEIAVKVAQVKQYQKQVEAYKQQVCTCTCLHLYMEYITCTCTSNTSTECNCNLHIHVYVHVVVFVHL